LEGSKTFFFEKKSQKTFGPAGLGDNGAKSRRNQSFFATFCSQKVVLDFPYSSVC
jgi:hypothetical protein